MNFDEPAFMQHPTLRDQFDSAREDAEEEEGKATSALDTELDASTDKEMDASGCLAQAPSAERHC